MKRFACNSSAYLSSKYRYARIDMFCNNSEFFRNVTEKILNDTRKAFNEYFALYAKKEVVPFANVAEEEEDCPF